jgi:hypothetical protein
MTAPEAHAWGELAPRALDGKAARVAGTTGEQLGEAVRPEALRGIEQAAHDPGRFLMQPVRSQSVGDDRVVVRPHGARVVTEGVVARMIR